MPKLVFDLSCAVWCWCTFFRGAVPCPRCCSCSLVRGITENSRKMSGVCKHPPMHYYWSIIGRSIERYATYTHSLVYPRQNGQIKRNNLHLQSSDDDDRTLWWWGVKLVRETGVRLPGSRAGFPCLVPGQVKTVLYGCSAAGTLYATTTSSQNIWTQNSRVSESWIINSVLSVE